MNTFELKLNMSSPLIEVGLDSWIILNREVAAVMVLDVTIDHQISELQEFLNVYQS